MNPPLRRPDKQSKLLDYVIGGELDIIGTDHAPHPVDTKDSDNPPSGIPCLPLWPKAIELLQSYGMDADLITRMTLENPCEFFGLKVTPRKIDVDYDPTLWDKYGWNPFSRVDGTL